MSTIALAVFLPIVSDMSGCSGNQAVAVSLRELSLGERMKMELIAAQLDKSADSLERALAALTRSHLVEK